MCRITYDKLLMHKTEYSQTIVFTFRICISHSEIAQEN